MRLSLDHQHHTWDSAQPPALEVGPGAEIELELQNASGGQLGPGSTASDVTGLDFTRVNPVTGPVHVAGARPGDALAVTVLDVEVADWGWTASIPGFGLLAEDFPDPYLVHATIGAGGVELPFGVTLPHSPMIGTLGVAPDVPGPHPLVPPSRFGGNLDVRHLGPGTTVVLPVAVEGALLSLGDAHAAMGDGEVCGTGVEVAATARIRVDLLPGEAPATPRLHGPSRGRPGDVVLTTGVGPDLHTAAQDACRAMIDHLGRQSGISPEDAYLLCSLTADLVVSEIVNQPRFVVSMHLPRSVLDQLTR